MPISIISGEKLQFLCDCYIDNNSRFDTQNGKNHLYIEPSKVVGNNFTDNTLLQTSNIIFIYTHFFYNKSNKELLKILHNELMKKTEPFKVVFHNSDFSVNQEMLNFFSDTKCTRIFAQNVNIIDPLLHYLPIGIANRKWPHGNRVLLNSIIDKNLTKKDNIFFNFSVNTHKSKRNKCRSALQNRIKFVTKYPNQGKYLTSLGSSKFCICPEGNGNDTHRLWEALYLKTIPICLKTTFSSIIAEDFPLFLIESWESLMLDNIYEQYESYISKLDYNKLSIGYWKNIIYNN